MTFCFKYNIMFGYALSYPSHLGAARAVIITKISLLGLLNVSVFVLSVKASSKISMKTEPSRFLFHYPSCMSVCVFGFYLSMKVTLEDLASVMCIKVDESTACVNKVDGRPQIATK